MRTLRRLTYNMLKIMLKRSYAGLLPKQKKTLEALGLKRIGSFVMRDDTKAVQGMIQKVPHLVSVETVDK